MPGSRRVNPEHQPSPAHLGRQYAHERKIYDPRSWKGRAVAYIQRLKNRFAGRNARDVLTQATAKHAAASKLSDRGVENLSPREQRQMMALDRAYERDVQHLTAPERAMQVLAKQKARGDQSTLVREQPTPELDQYQNRADVRTDIGMKSVQTLGEGAYGKVDSVKPGLAGPISVKKTALGNEDGTARQALLEEGAMLRRLNHPNIIKPHGEGRHFEFRPTLEMEDGGGTLEQYIHGGAVMGNNGNIALLSGVVVSTRGRFEYEPEYGPEYDPESVPSAPKAIIHQYGGAVSTQDSKSCMTQILSALEYLRENNIVHRDIKPQNILINPGNGHVKLADFWEAEHVKAHRTLKTAAGTPGYMAPEVMEVYLATANAGSGCGVESDMFSAGCMFYELLTGTKYLQTTGSDITIVLQHELNMVKERNVQQWMQEKSETQLFKVEPHNQEHVIALLTGMLEPDPQKRLTPVQAQAILAKITPEPPAP